MLLKMLVLGCGFLSTFCFSRPSGTCEGGGGGWMNRKALDLEFEDLHSSPFETLGIALQVQ